MSNLPLQSAVIHNDDNDDQINSSNNKLSTINSRITSPLIIKRQQNNETEIANNQAYDEIHDLQSKHSSIKKTNNDNSYMKNSTQYYQSKLNNSHELMQGNYYDQTRYDINSSSSNHLSEPVLININLEDYKKTITPVSASKNNSNNPRSNSPPFGNTSESIQQGIAQSAGILLELNKKQHHHHHHHHHHKNSMKNSTKSHEQAVINYFPTANNDNSTQRSLSPSSSDCSTSDSSTSNKCCEENDKTNIPYEKLLNDEDDDDINNNNNNNNNEELIESPKKPLTESTTLLNKNLPQTYGTQSTSTIPCERSKYLPNNGYNSHGSSITTKSSSDNSGSIRTNSGSDNDEESDEEHYNNSTISNNSHSTSLFPRTNDASIKSVNRANDIRYSYSNEQTSYQSGRSNITRSEQIDNNDEHHLQVPRFKQLSNDDPNGNTTNKLNSGTDHNTLPYTSKWSLQQSSDNQTNTPASSSHQNRNLLEPQEQQQQHHSNSSRNNSRQHQIRTIKKRKQSQQQETIRTELIPGHRGDLDVDELVMFIDGNSSKQRQNAALLHPTDTNKPKINSLNDTNSEKTTSRKKSRKSIKILQQSSINNNENQTTTHSIVDITNQSSGHRNISTTINNNDEFHLNTVDLNSTNTTNGKPSLPDWFEQTRNTSLQNDDVDSYSVSPAITNNSNSETISEPFVTVTHRRRLLKERRQDTNPPVRSARCPPSSSNINDKRRILSTSQNGILRPTIRNNLSNNRPINSLTTKEETNNSIPSQSVPPQLPPQTELSSSCSVVHPTNEQSSPRLSSHSSSSSVSSLIKRQSKPPPVVFLNRSHDVELNDVSFGFDLDSTTLTKPSTKTELNLEPINTSSQPSTESTESNEIVTDSTTEKSSRRFQQRNNRGSQFYSGSDIRPQHHRNYPSQPMQQSPYIDPLLLLQYNQQQRLANYSQQVAYMNLLRSQYISSQPQYVYLPTTYATTTTATTATNETDVDDATNQTSTEQIQEPLLVYATPAGQFYFQPPTTKKSYIDSDQQSTPISSVYTTTPPAYPSHYFYPPQAQHLVPTHPAYFQPIVSPSLSVDTKLEQNNINGDEDYEKSTKLYLQARQQSSSDIMSNALQLVYSQQRRNAQTDRFNLDDLTAYLAMKWTDTVDHYEQGDNRILLVHEK